MCLYMVAERSRRMMSLMMCLMTKSQKSQKSQKCQKAEGKAPKNRKTLSGDRIVGTWAEKEAELHKELAETQRKRKEEEEEAKARQQEEAEKRVAKEYRTNNILAKKFDTLVDALLAL